METITIYEDKEQKIDLSKDFYNYVYSQFVPMIQLSRAQINNLVSVVEGEYKKEFPESKKIKINYYGRCPVIKFGFSLSMSGICSVFNEMLDGLCGLREFDINNIEEIEDNLTELMDAATEGEGISKVKFFNKPIPIKNTIYCVDGYSYYLKGNTMILLFWGVKTYEDLKSFYGAE